MRSAAPKDARSDIVAECAQRGKRREAPYGKTVAIRAMICVSVRGRARRTRVLPLAIIGAIFKHRAVCWSAAHISRPPSPPLAISCVYAVRHRRLRRSFCPCRLVDPPPPQRTMIRHGRRGSAAARREALVRARGEESAVRKSEEIYDVP